MKKIKIEIQYQGTFYSGWQYQDNADTIQKRVQDALGTVLNEEIVLHGVGRTDGGVHAERFVAHFDTNSNVSLGKICLGANCYLPNDISVLNATVVDEKFDARFGAKNKTYVYRLYISSSRRPLLEFNHTQLYKPLDLDLMRKVAKDIVGTHDFVAFASTGSVTKDTVRTVYDISIVSHDDIVEIFVKGNGFLYNMVRNISGFLVWVGSHKIVPDELEILFSTGKRKTHFKTLPAKGLTLLNVEY